LVIDPKYAEEFYKLESFNYIYVIYFLDRMNQESSMIVSSLWTDGKRVGVFASRSPIRPNLIGISVVKLRAIENNVIYIKDLDTKDDANYGWIEELEDKDHLILYIRGIPHDY